MLNDGGQRRRYAQIAHSKADKLVFFDVWALSADIENVEFAAPIHAIGNVFTARITKIDSKTRLAFLTLGNTDAVMRLKTKDQYTEGQYILAEIISEAYDDKNLRVRFVGDVKLGDKHQPKLYKAAQNLTQYCLKLAQDNECQIVTDDFAFYASLKKQIGQDSLKVELAEVISHKKDGLALLERANLADQIDELQMRQIKLKNSGSIIIEHTKAMTVVDVNSGAYTGNNMNDDINQMAAQKLFEQLELRHIGGLVIVDFLKYKRKSERDAFSKFLRDLARDYAIEMGSYTGFGLAELIIKRDGMRLDEKLLGLNDDK